MIEYIYIVKCPNCEDEPFHFFNDAKTCAMGYLSDKPVITQVEVNRNDFGECTDSQDLGIIWTWENVTITPDAEPSKSVCTKSDLKAYNAEEDPEFVSIDNSVNSEPETSEISDDETTTDNARKPIPEGMTIKQLVEEMEKNEDTVECVGCEELFPKEDCFFVEDIGWLCGDCEDRIVKCTWCDELYDKSDCRYEVDMGWLCDRCEAAIKSRGETLTFRENNYWDFLDEAVETNELSECSDQKDLTEKLEDPEEYRARLDTCPECGSEKSFDKTSRFCLNCGWLDYLTIDRSDKKIDEPKN